MGKADRRCRRAQEGLRAPHAAAAGAASPDSLRTARWAAGALLLPPACSPDPSCAGDAAGGLAFFGIAVINVVAIRLPKEVRCAGLHGASQPQTRHGRGSVASRTIDARHAPTTLPGRLRAASPGGSRATVVVGGACCSNPAPAPRSPALGALFWTPPAARPSDALVVQYWTSYLPIMLTNVALLLATALVTTLLVLPWPGSDDVAHISDDSLRLLGASMSQQASALAQPAVPPADRARTAATSVDGKAPPSSWAANAAANGKALQESGQPADTGLDIENPTPVNPQQEERREALLAAIRLWASIKKAQTVNMVTFIEPPWWQYTALYPGWIRPRCAKGGRCRSPVGCSTRRPAICEHIPCPKAACLMPVLVSSWPRPMQRPDTSSAMGLWRGLARADLDLCVPHHCCLDEQRVQARAAEVGQPSEQN